MELFNTTIGPQLAPSFVYKTKPYDHQIAAFNFAINKEFFALFMEQGTGKTKVTIDLANAMYMKGQIDAVMVVAPNGIHYQWAKEQLPKHSVLPYTAAVFKASASKGRRNQLDRWLVDKPGIPKWLMVNVESFSYDTYLSMFQAYLKNHKVFLVIDEATAIKNPTANRTVNVLARLGTAIYRGKALVKYTPDSVVRCILTGTPVTNSVYDIWSMFYFLKPNFFGRTYYAFKAHHGIEAKMVIFVGGLQKNITRPIKKSEIQDIHTALDKGESFLAIAEKYQVKEEDVLYLKAHPDCDVPYKNLQELKQMITPYSFIAKKKDCYDLPDKTYKKVLVDLTTEQQRLYNDLKEEYITMFYDAEVAVHQKIALYTRLSQIVGGFLPYTDEASGIAEIKPTDKTNPKVDAVIRELEEATFPVLITTRFRAEARYLKERLIKAYPTLTVDLVIGGISNKDAILDRYKNGKLDLLVANEKIISKGHNLQNGDTIYTYSQGYSTETREQREDRIHRDGQRSKKCLYVDFIGRDTIDMEVYAVVRAGRKLLEYMTDKKVGEFLTTHSDEFIKEFQDEEEDNE